VCIYLILIEINSINRINKLDYECIIFLDPYLPIHHTTFMALRFILRPFILRMHTASSWLKNCPKIMIIFDSVHQKVGKP